MAGGHGCGSRMCRLCMRTCLQIWHEFCCVYGGNCSYPLVTSGRGSGSQMQHAVSASNHRALAPICHQHTWFITTIGAVAVVVIHGRHRDALVAVEALKRA